MKKDTRARILIIKDYLEKWDWNIAPLFMVAEEDAKALIELIEDNEKKIEKRKAKYERLKNSKS